MLSYNKRYHTLNSIFKLGKDCHIKESGIDVRFFDFNSRPEEQYGDICNNKNDSVISENNRFLYPIFLPVTKAKYEKAIIMLHGLNERTWNKYLSWAEFMAIESGLPVILFPLAFHINRAPLSWSNPRSMIDALAERRTLFAGENSTTYANLALSNRLSERPDRFYLSGHQSLLDIVQLFETIKHGNNPLFKAGTEINIFAYSIGALLAQTILMNNQKNLFSNSRLFMFCGGSIFNSMSGESRFILDKPAFKNLKQYYYYTFGNESKSFDNQDGIYNTFQSMIREDKYTEERITFFTESADRIGGIALKNDKVIPYYGVKQAMGDANATRSISLQDFSFNYTHENPFPHNEKDTTALNNAFRDVFSVATSFLT